MPGHEDSTPSFYVHPDKQVFRCHGCGEGGDVITLAMKVKGLGFLDACQYLGMSRERDRARRRTSRQDAKEIVILQQMKDWRSAINAAIQDRLQSIFQTLHIASQCDVVAYSRLNREWRILSDMHDDLWTTEGLCKLWVNSDAIEKILDRSALPED